MTRREASIVSAYTGYFIGGLDDLYNYLSELIGRPVYTHEIPAVLDEYHSKIRQDFVMLEVLSDEERNFIQQAIDILAKNHLSANREVIL